MQIEETVFFQETWRWSPFLKYALYKLEKNDCSEYFIPSEYSYRESSFGSKNNKQNVSLLTLALKHQRINLARAVCINSPNYSVLNFLIIPNQIYNVPFLGVDFVTLPKMHLLVLDFQPSLKIEKQFDNKLLERLLILKGDCHRNIPIAEEFSSQLSSFFSPGLIWSKLPKEDSSDFLISTQLFSSFKSYLDLYLEVLFQSNPVQEDLEKEIITGQNAYLQFRKDNDPARPMLRSLFGDEFCESLINNVLFTIK